MLKKRVERLKRAIGQGNPSLSPEERVRLEQLDHMEEDDPGYDLWEHMELYLKSKPRITFEELLEQLEDDHEELIII